MRPLAFTFWGAAAGVVVGALVILALSFEPPVRNSSALAVIVLGAGALFGAIGGLMLEGADWDDSEEKVQ